MAKSIAEYFVGQSAGYGGGAMAGGPTAPVNWAGTPSGPQTSRRLQNYPASRRVSYMQGNTVIGSSLYDTITPDDLKDDRFSEDEIFAGLRWEMKHMEYPSKDVARPTVIKNLEKNPKYYSDLDMYFKSDKQGNIMENVDPQELEMGMEIEREHTQDEALAKKIAMDHLEEDPKYYTKLKAAGLEEDKDSEEESSEDEDEKLGDEFSDNGDTEIGDESDEDIESPSDFADKSPSVVKITLAAPVKIGSNQSSLASSELGSGSPKSLSSTNLVAPETKVINSKNTVSVSKTPSMDGVADPLNHFMGQMRCGLKEKW